VRNNIIIVVCYNVQFVPGVRGADADIAGVRLENEIGGGRNLIGIGDVVGRQVQRAPDLRRAHYTTLPPSVVLANKRSRRAMRSCCASRLAMRASNSAMRASPNFKRKSYYKMKMKDYEIRIMNARA
jgi:hypothetical protein